MCWLGQTDKEKMLRVTGHDIHVKKVLKKVEYEGRAEYLSPISKAYTNKDFTWKVGCEYKTQMNMFTEFDFLYGKRGFHSSVKLWLIMCYKAKYWCSCVSPINIVKSEDKCDVLCDFVIPKGAQYYVNHCGEYISDRLRFVGESKQEECTQMSTEDIEEI